MKILVTGATSLIGKELIALLLEEGHEIRSVTRQKTPPPIINKTDTRYFDLADAPNEIAASIDVVIHIAAATPGANSSTEDYRKTNIEGTKRLISICESEKVKRLIFISSIVVLYDDLPSSYAYSKKEAEAMICKSDLDWTILRPSEIIGADKSWKGFLQMVRNKKTVMVPGTGNQLRHPVYYRDVIKAIKQVVNSSNVSGKKYTLAAARPITYYQFLLNVKKLFNCNYKIMIVPMWLIRSLSALDFLLPGKVKRKLTNAHGMMKNFSFDIQDAKTDFNYDPADVETALRQLKEEM